METLLKGNDINVTWSIVNHNFTSTKPLVYIVDSISKRLVDVIVSNNISFKIPGDQQHLGEVRLECFYTKAGSNKRIVANKVMEFVDNAEAVSNQDYEYSNCNILSTGLKSKITFS